MNWKRPLLIVGWFMSLFALTTAATLILLFVLTRPADKVIQTWKQTDNVKYDNFGPYYLSVVESEWDWRGFPIHVGQNYFIYVGKESGKPTYGHVLDFSFYPSGEQMETHIKKSSVEWTNEGVTLITESGHKVFVPKAMFIGGR
jgi:hypothetical protein